ncbi:MAG: hypothetical protein KC964_25390 [Candidatus Omnitrophica bacterium]|nr:hypothetical protein [Candidatus Omnitrophota bacterium]
MNRFSALVSFFESLFRTPVGIAVVLVIYILVPVLGRHIDPGDYTPMLGYSSEAQSSRNTSAVARLFGEFRTSMSDIMFLKTERYLHSGVGYQPHITEKDLTGDDDGTEVYKGTKTLIRTPSDDWRGFIGHLEREIKPWSSPEFHMQHQKGVELLPWFRLMTLVNPHRIRGYRIGAFLLMSSGEKDAIVKAREFIEEGIKNNPKSHELQFMMVRTYQQEISQNRADIEGWTDEDEVPLLKMALVHAQKAIELGAKVRPEAGWKGKGRPNEMEDSFAACLHYEIFVLRRLGRDQEALEKAIYSKRNFGTDPIIESEIQELRVKVGEAS